MNGFTELTPDRFLPALEAALGVRLGPTIRPLPSYINRVYEVRTEDEIPYIAKFYRPGRWTLAALQDEQDFLADCAESEIPVVCPLKLSDGKGLGLFDGIPFAVFPRRAGRQFDIEGDESWLRIGQLLGRLHNTGQKMAAPARLVLTPQETTVKYAEQLVKEGVTANRRQAFSDICQRIIDVVTPLFEGMDRIRIHGDFHSGNIIERPGEGLMIIDFDDMMNGPAVQDFWLLLPDHYPACAPLLDRLLVGYRQFREVSPRSALLIEGLRAMRIIYFAAWCNMQRDDFQFQARFPEWGTDAFWLREIHDLSVQYANILDALQPE
ncbi:MAG: serine/threonine protein kinase [Fibrobacterota bacterium]